MGTVEQQAKGLVLISVRSRVVRIGREGETLRRERSFKRLLK